MPRSPSEADLVVGPGGGVTEQQPKAPRAKVGPTVGKAKVRLNEPTKVKPFASAEPGRASYVSSVTYH